MAYSIRKGAKNSSVEGIVHDVPIGDLAAFLRFEGVLDEDFQLKEDKGDNRRRYGIEKSTVQLCELDLAETCFVLIGSSQVSNESRREGLVRKHRDKLVEYVSTAMKGAVDFGIDTSPFHEDLRWVEGIR